MLDSDYDVIETEKKKRDYYEEPPRQRAKRWPWVLALGCLGCCCLCWVGPLCAVIAGGVTIAAILDSNTVSTSGSERIEVDPDNVVMLDITNEVGDVVIRQGSENEVLVEYTKKAFGFDKTGARRELDNMTVNVRQDDAGRVIVQTDQGNTGDSFFSNANTIDLTISVPENIELRINTDVGDVRISEVRVSAMTVMTTTGDIEFNGTLAASGAFRLTTDVGSITVGLPGTIDVRLDASTNVGDVTLSGFDTLTRDGGSSGVSDSWRGLIGESNEDPPSLTLNADVGDIEVSAR